MAGHRELMTAGLLLLLLQPFAPAAATEVNLDSGQDGTPTFVTDPQPSPPDAGPDITVVEHNEDSITVLTIDGQRTGGGVMMAEVALDDDDYGSPDGESADGASYIIAVVAAVIAILSVAVAVMLRRNKHAGSLVERLNKSQTTNAVPPPVPKLRTRARPKAGTPVQSQNPDASMYETPVPLSAQRGNWLSRGKAFNTPTTRAIEESHVLSPISVNLTAVQQIDATAAVTPAMPDTVRRVKFGGRVSGPAEISTPNVPGQITSAHKRTRRKAGTPASDYIRPAPGGEGPAPPTQPRRGTASRLISLYERIPSLARLVSGSRLSEADEDEDDVEVWNVDQSPESTGAAEATAFETPYLRNPIQYDIGVEQTPYPTKAQMEQLKLEEQTEEQPTYDLGTAPPVADHEDPSYDLGNEAEGHDYAKPAEVIAEADKRTSL